MFVVNRPLNSAEDLKLVVGNRRCRGEYSKVLYRLYFTEIKLEGELSMVLRDYEQDSRQRAVQQLER